MGIWNAANDESHSDDRENTPWQGRGGCPYWFLFVLTATLPTVWFIRHRRNVRMKRAGKCKSCGYDLRASGEKCPECGSPLPADRENQENPGKLRQIADQVKSSASKHGQQLRESCDEGAMAAPLALALALALHSKDARPQGGTIMMRRVPGRRRRSGRPAGVH